MPCKHLIHKYCLEEVFRKRNNRCPTCEQIILPGYQAALLSKRLVNSEVLKKKQEYDDRVTESSAAPTGQNRIMNGNYGTIGIGMGLQALGRRQERVEEDEEEDKLEDTVDVNIGKAFKQILS